MTVNESFTSGSCTTFAGATGLLQALLDFVVGTEVSAENLSGSGTTWSGTLAGYPVGFGRITVDYSLSATPYEGVDDGTGNITGTGITSGTINYETGAYSITFTGTPDSTPTIDYIYGDPGRDWQQLFKRNTQDKLGNDIWAGDPQEVILQNTGNSGLEEVMIGIREWYYVGDNAYGWNLNGYLWYTPDMDWRANINEQGTVRESYNTTYNTYNTMPNLPLIDATMYYWIFSNRQRIIVAVKVQSNYESCYLGFANRYSPPSKYPFPLVIKGSHYGAGNQSDTGNWRRGIARNHYDTYPYGYPLLFSDPGGQWRNTIGSGGTIIGVEMCPGDLAVDNGSIGLLTDGSVFSQTVSIGNHYDSALYVDLDGVKQLLGPNIQSEDILKDPDNLKRYIIFQDISRTSYQDFFAVEQGPYTTTTSTTTTTTTT